ncbi:MAG TPA: hypothetical protein VFN96_01825 [Gemmatimonadales bacterium]|nr:hypothetical protein [Gemmatimonadales bacterium]
MTTMVQPRPVTPESEQEHPLLEALKARRTLLVRGGIALLVVVVGIWFYRESGRRKAQAGSEALDRARIAAETGNLPVASSELQKVSQTYAGSEPGYLAVIALNEVRLSMGQAQIAADDLRSFVGRNPPATHAASAYALLGAASENLGKFDDAAQAYARSAELAPEPYRQVDGMLGQARALRLAGKAPEALTVLRGILSRYSKETPGVAEAEVRLSELTSGAM